MGYHGYLDSAGLEDLQIVLDDLNLVVGEVEQVVDRRRRYPRGKITKSAQIVSTAPSGNPGERI